MSENKIPQSEITRVKGLGFLWDKRTADRFNGRVITRNGKLTSDEQRAVAEAAGFADCRAVNDLTGRPRVLVGRKPPAR